MWEVRRKNKLGAYTIATTRSAAYADDICRAMAAYDGGEYLAVEIKNPRGAGRDPIYTDDIREDIIDRHNRGETLRQIAEEVGCSKSFVHQLISGQKEERRLYHE